MQLIELKDLKYQAEIKRFVGAEFLQSREWYELLHREGEKTEIWALEDGGGIAGNEMVEDRITEGRIGDSKIARGEIIASVLIIKKKLFANFFYYYVPRGPLGNKKIVLQLLKELKIKKRGTIFFRIEPVADIFTVKNEFNFKKTIDLQPQKTLCLDLSLSEAELLQAMHQKTRYNIRLAEKKGVSVKVAAGVKLSETIKSLESSKSLDTSNSPDSSKSLETFKWSDSPDFLEFWRLMKLTSERDGFRLHSRRHYENLLTANENIKLYLARFEGRVIAAGLFSFFGNTVTYLHGASFNKARRVMAPYLLQWTVIKEAKKQNKELIRNGKALYKYYDFYGIDEQKWPGVTRFKLGFGGFIKEYPGTYDLILRPGIYNFYLFLRLIRKVVRKIIR